MDSVGYQPWESSCLVFFVSFCALEEITSELFEICFVHFSPLFIY